MDIRKYFSAVNPKKETKRENELITDEEPFPKKAKTGEKTSSIKKTPAAKKESKKIELIDDEEPFPRKRAKKTEAKAKKQPIDDSGDEASTGGKKDKIQSNQKAADDINKISAQVRSKKETEPLLKTSKKPVETETTPPKEKKATNEKQVKSLEVEKEESPAKLKLEEKPIEMKRPASDHQIATPKKHKPDLTSPSATTVSPQVPRPEPLYEVTLCDKYRPQSSDKIVGQHGDRSCVKKLINWLKKWDSNFGKKPAFGKLAADDGSGFRAALLSGPPGIGKTTAAQVVCRELGYQFTEFNASDTRNKKTLVEEVATVLSNKVLSNYFKATYTGKDALSAKHAIIMDEVDGMAGNEDRGGIAELIQLIKNTKVPIICICNDRSSPKVRNLANYCFDLRFMRPRKEQIKAAMMSICYKEKINISADALDEIIVSSNLDMRQVLNYLSFLSSYVTKQDRIKGGTIKDVRLGPFDAIKQTFHCEDKELSFNEKSDLFFSDYSLIPLFVYENYLLVNPFSAGHDNVKKLKLASKCIRSLSFANLIENEIRSSQNWSLLPMQAAFTTVIPGFHMKGRMSGMINFPALLGKISSVNKKARLLQELYMHMSLKVSGNKTTLNLEYLPALRRKIYQPLIRSKNEGISQVMESLNYYSLRKEDLDNMIELSLWPAEKDPSQCLEPKLKAALTRTINSQAEPLPYNTMQVTKGKKVTIAPVYDEIEEEDGEGGDEPEETDNDPIIKPKKVTKKGEKPAKKTAAKPRATGGARGGRGGKKK